MLPRNPKIRADALRSSIRNEFWSLVFEKEDKRLLFIGFLSNKLRTGFFGPDRGNAKKTWSTAGGRVQKPIKILNNMSESFGFIVSSLSKPINFLILWNVCGLGTSRGDFPSTYSSRFELEGGVINASLMANRAEHFHHECISTGGFHICQTFTQVSLASAITRMTTAPSPYVLVCH